MAMSILAPHILGSRNINKTQRVPAEELGKIWFLQRSTKMTSPRQSPLSILRGASGREQCTWQEQHHKFPQQGIGTKVFIWYVTPKYTCWSYFVHLKLLKTLKTWQWQYDYPNEDFSFHSISVYGALKKCRVLHVGQFGNYI